MKKFNKIHDRKVDLAVKTTIEVAYNHQQFADDIRVVINFDATKIGGRVLQIRRETEEKEFQANWLGIRHSKYEGRISERALWNIAHSFGDIIEDIAVLTHYKEVETFPHFFDDVFYTTTKTVAVYKTVFDRAPARKAKEKYLRRCAWGAAHC